MRFKPMQGRFGDLAGGGGRELSDEGLMAVLLTHPELRQRAPSLGVTECRSSTFVEAASESKNERQDGCLFRSAPEMIPDSCDAIEVGLSI